jgi:Holliday junction resolvase RusA-like endonuclease
MSSADEWQLVLPWEPWAKIRPQVSRGGHRTHQHPKDRAAEDRTRDFLRDNWKHPVLTTNVRLSAFFFRSSRQVIDQDNLLKHILDAASGICWVNDCQVTAYGVVELHLDREAPRTHIWVEPHDEASLLRHYDPDTGKALPI